MTRTELVEHVVERNADFLRSIARRHARTLQDAEDALQETTRIALERLPLARDAALPWIVTTLKRKCWELGRKHTTSDELVPELANTLDPLAHCEAREALRNLRSLKPDERLALLMLGAGWSYREIAATLDWTYTKVNRCIHEGRATARERQLVEVEAS